MRAPTMPLSASCPRCGFSLDEPDLSTGLPPCPSCGSPLEVVPEADPAPPPPPPEAPPPPAVEAPPPPPPLLSASWPKVRRGLRLMQVALRLFFAGWGLVVMAGVGVLVL